MEDVIPDYANTIAAGDVLVAGSNFGCGSSREHAPISIKVAGTSCVIAESFARIFYRNAINIGLPIIESPEAAKAIDQGDELDINFEEGIIQNLTKNENYHFEKFPEFIQQLVVAGNLLNYVKAKVNK